MASPTSGPPPPSAATQRGKVVAGRYRLDRPIGSGGMATVWAATHLALNQPIALKFIDIIGHRVDIAERFLREARVAAAVRHRNVVDIIDFGRSEDGQPYMAMELLVGRSLGERMEENRSMPVREVVRVMARVLSGLGAVHDVGLVHRDVKPENIFLVEDADGVYPKLLDFGVSRSLDRSSEIKSVLYTTENAIVGTPQYMSPEQARGLSTVDQRSDLWSAGVVLFELLTGQLPYDAEATGDVIIKIATEEPPDFAELRPDLAGPIEDVIKRSMRKNPEERFGSAREMRSALLAAVTQTALHLHARPRTDSFECDTLDPTEPVDLLKAVGDAYEPGDSGLIDFSEHLELLESVRPVALPPPPPPPTRGAFAKDVVVPPRRRLTPLAVVVAGSVSLAVAGTVSFLVLRTGPTMEVTELAVTESPDVSVEISEPIFETSPAEISAAGLPAAGAGPQAPPAETVIVTLEDVPSRTSIWVDGTEWTAGPRVELPRDGDSHAIVVRARDGRTWTHQHVADDDGSYAVVMPGRARRGARTGRSRRRGLIRDPGF